MVVSQKRIVSYSYNPKSSLLDFDLEILTTGERSFASKQKGSNPMSENEETITVSKRDLINFIKYHHHPRSEPIFDMREVDKAIDRNRTRYNSHLTILGKCGLKFEDGELL